MAMRRRTACRRNVHVDQAVAPRSILPRHQSVLLRLPGFPTKAACAARDIERQVTDTPL
jgi:hypothetical protein